MKTLFTLSIAVLLSFSLKSQNIDIVDFNSLQQRYTNSSDTTYIVNFFASWCAPCIKELPDLLNFADSKKDYKVKLILVSLDMKDDYKNSLSPILNKFIIKQKVFLLDEPNADKWIRNLDSNWNGSIPATLIINNRKKVRKFIGEKITYQTLTNLIK